MDGKIISINPAANTGRFIKKASGNEIVNPFTWKERSLFEETIQQRYPRYYPTQRKREALTKGWGGPLEWLFYNSEGGMLDIPNLRKRIFYKSLEKAGLKQIRLHDLRSTYATLRIQAGHNIADVSKQLGHHSIKVTVDTYYKWMPGTNSEEVKELDSKSAPIRNQP